MKKRTDTQNYCVGKSADQGRWDIIRQLAESGKCWWCFTPVVAGSEPDTVTCPTCGRVFRIIGEDNGPTKPD